jgi:predicted AAA+ superfamily ATPase
VTDAAGTPLGRLVERRAIGPVRAALTDTRVVLVNGARQSGKSTLVRLVAGEHGAEWRSLDRAVTRTAAEHDPTGFVDVTEPLVIDEIQRVPELFLAIKEKVDLDSRPGQFLLTGSARVLGLRGLPDSLPGRMETVELWPFSQGEIDGAPDGFVDAVFRDGPSLTHTSGLTRRDYAERVVRGGFPEAVARSEVRRRERFFESYLADLVTRDIAHLGEIERLAQLRALIRMLAARSGQILSVNGLRTDLGVSNSTVARYLGLLEEVFLIKRIPAWSRNVDVRATGAPKVAFVDSGLAANLLGADPHSLLRPEGAFGPLLEGFVLMELSRQLGWSRERVDVFHFRTRDKTEVDCVLENRRGQVVAVEVKASLTVRGEDFRGIRHLADRLGDDLLVGLVLYAGTQTLPFGPKLRAMPISALWGVS